MTDDADLRAQLKVIAADADHWGNNEGKWFLWAASVRKAATRIAALEAEVEQLNARFTHVVDKATKELAAAYLKISDMRAAEAAMRERADLADNAAVDRFAAAMKQKLARKRIEDNRGGWQKCPASSLWQMLRDHVEKGDPVDVGNFAMMIYCNTMVGQPGAEQPNPPAPEPPHIPQPVTPHNSDFVFDAKPVGDV
jgi:hypothetical protein